MKKQVVILAIALLLMGLTQTFGQAVQNNGEVNLTKAQIDNYLLGLKSENDGIRLSCAYFAGEYQISEAIVPLMAMIHNDKTECGRIMAALALTKIGSDMSIYVVKRAAEFDKSNRVRNLCTKFYNHYVMQEQNKEERL